MLGPVLLGLELSACGITLPFGSSRTTTSTTGNTGTVTTSALTTTAGRTTTVSVATNVVPGGLVGHWLGPFPSAPGACNPEYAEWWFYSTGSYTFSSNSAPVGTVTAPAGSTTPTPSTTPGCGVGVTLYGKFTVQGDVITLDQQGDPGCPPCAQTGTLSFGFTILSPTALQICDTTSGLCWTYQRQPN
ncbi:MAG: hypothetical protein ACLQVK_07190 [Acidimicrobiales bacterium]